MADKISGLTKLTSTPAAGDVVAIVDVSDTTQATSGSTRGIEMTHLLGGLPKIVTGYQGYVIVAGPTSTNRYLCQTGDIIIGKGAFAGGNMIMAVANTNSPSIDADLDFYVNATVIP